MASTSTKRFARQYPFNERGRCHWCGGPIKPPRQTWCSEECVAAWRIRSDSHLVRAELLSRDHGICASCGLDCASLDEAIFWMVHVQFRDHWWHGSLARAWLEEVGLGRFSGKYGALTSTWAGHHVKPVHQGGGECDLDNYVTLCWRCHAEAHRGKARRT